MQMKKKKLIIAAGAAASLAAGLSIGCKSLNKKEKNSEEMSEKGTDRALPSEATFYERYIKRALDMGLSFCGIIVLSPVLAISSATVFLEDPGPVVFKQKRVGIHKTYFQIHKLRSMKLNTPDVPTHLMENPEQYILKTGKIYRKISVDELYQLFDILRGRMSIVGPRPALWNQDDLIVERDKYGANDVLPGLTGWAQINGRDELEIPVKAKLDGEYCRALRKSSWSGFKMDCKCFFGTIKSVLSSEGVVEGGTGAIESNKIPEVSQVYDCEIEPSRKKKVLIIGFSSYIGCALYDYLSLYPDCYEIERLQARGLKPSADMFKGYDVIFDAAGIAHIKETEENRELYYDVNRDLTIKIAEAAKQAGVQQFVLLSSMSVYGKTIGHITKATPATPNNAYGDSKSQADKVILNMANESFKVAVLRPPMVYGKNCKGNYQTLRKFAMKSPVFLQCKNERSMIYIGNLCEFVKCLIDKEDAGIFFPQNKEYVNTSAMVRSVAGQHNKKIIMLRGLNPIIKIAPINFVKKVFGSLTYEKVDLIGKYNFQESMELTEKCGDGVE